MDKFNKILIPVSTLAVLGCADAKDDRPNIIYVYPDQFRNQALAFWNEPEYAEHVAWKADPVKTPRLDGFADESVVFSTAMSNCPLSSPYRGIFLTGMYPERNGITLNCMAERPESSLREDAICISDVLSEQGYSCGYIGKLHADHPTPNDPANPGHYVSDRRPEWDAYTPAERRHGFSYWYSYGTFDEHKNPHYWDTDGVRHDPKEWSVGHETDKAIEQLAGKWICEIAELSALTKAKEIESVKAFITRQRDSYRRPYDRNVTELPRRCVCIGTTNLENFLVDLSGNRRFYPVQTNSDGYWLYDHERECRDYILQCWAEAAKKYQDGKMPNFAKPELVNEYKKAQDASMVDDWRVGVVNEWLDSRPIDSVICVRQVFHEALSNNPDFPVDPMPKEAREVGQMITNNPDWEKVGTRALRNYGKQKAWKKVQQSFTPEDDDEPSDESDLDLPFD